MTPAGPEGPPPNPGRRSRPGLLRALARAALVPAALVPAALVLAACSTNTTSSSTTTTTGASTTTTAGPTTTTTAPAASTTTAAGVSVCLASALKMVATNGSGAAGTIEMAVTMTNEGSPCTLDGYPGMQLLDASSQPITTTVVRAGGPNFADAAANQPPAQVVLAPGAVAKFSFSYEDVPVGNETSCPTSTSSEVTPPNDTAFAVIPLAVAPCDNGTIHVSPVYLAPTG